MTDKTRPALTKTSLIADINALIAEMDSLIGTLEKRKELGAEGSIRCSSRGNRIEYTHVTPDGSRKYISNDNRELIETLARKAHFTKMINAAENEKKQLMRCISILESGSAISDIDEVFPALHEGIRKKTGPLTVSGDGYAINWERRMQAMTRGVKTIRSDLTTEKGECVKSKSEIIIADRLHHAGVPYVYEVTLSFNDGNNFLYPDFLVLNKRTRREYVWEHLGKMDSTDYCYKNIGKLESFVRNGFIPGKNMILSMESSTKQLNTAYVDTMIKEYLL